MKKIAFIALTVFAAMQVRASPFGLTPGSPLDDVRKAGTFVASETDFTYVAKNLLQGTPDFDSYSVLVTPKQGLCRIVALSGDLYTDGYGRQLKTRFHELTSALASKYGTPRVSLDISKTIDLSRNFGLWNLGGIGIDDGDWMDALLLKKRQLSAEWQGGAGVVEPVVVGMSGSGLPDSLASIALEGRARTPSSAYLRLEYRFKNYGECMTELQAKRSANL
jgi:hypothetical protein